MLCNACVEVALMLSEEARDVYAQIEQAYRLPDCEKAYYRLQEAIPEGKELIEQVTKRLGLVEAQQRAKPGLWLPNGSTLELFVDMLGDYFPLLKPWIDFKKNKAKSRDFAYLFERMGTFVRVAFNSESDRRRGRYKVEENGSTALIVAIQSRVMGQQFRLQLKEWEKLKVLRFGTKVYDLGEILTDADTTRMHRYMTSQYRLGGYLLRHDEIMARTAWRWYQCRVVHSGPLEFCQWVEGHGPEKMRHTWNRRTCCMR